MIIQFFFNFLDAENEDRNSSYTAAAKHVQMNCERCLRRGFVYFKFTPASPELYVCAEGFRIMPLGFDLIDKAVRADECLTLAHRLPPKDEIYELSTGDDGDTAINYSNSNNDSLAEFKIQLLSILNKTLINNNNNKPVVIERNSGDFEFVLIHIIELVAICVMMIFYSTLNYMKRARNQNIEMENL